MGREPYLDGLLPDREISLGNILYHIHGLIHGTPLVKINPFIKRYISGQLSGKGVLCEDGFVSWINGSVSMREFDFFNLKRFSLSEYILTVGKLLSHYRAQKKGMDPEIIKKVREISSPSEFNEIRESLIQNYPPEPEGMNSLLLKKNAGTLEDIKGEIPLRIKRYVYEAKRSIEYSEDNNLDELHIVVGCAHELPLEYLLRNPKILSELSEHLS